MASAQINEVVGWLAHARHAVALTGAGISTESGIPDFRGPQGVWTREPEAEKRCPTSATTWPIPRCASASWQSRLNHPAWTREPNAGHRALVELERRGRLHALITQNIDGLHQAAGNSPERVIEVHGTMRESMCLSLRHARADADALERVRAGEDDPACRDCGGILKSATISFGQPLVPEVIDRAMRAAAARPTCSSPSARRCRSTRSPALPSARAARARRS